MDAKFQAAARRIMVGREESEEVILLAEEDFQLLMVFILPCKCKKRFQMGSEGKGERDIGDGAPIFIADRGISDP